MSLKLCLGRPLLTFQRLQRARYSTIPSEAVVVADDRTVVCWHPEKPFPYEFTRPLPIQAVEDDSPINAAAQKAISIFRKKKPEAVREELAKMTFTTKHRWYPRARDKRAKNTPPDREYL